MFFSEYIFLLLFRDLCSVYAKKKKKAVCVHLSWKCLWRRLLDGESVWGEISGEVCEEEALENTIKGYEVSCLLGSTNTGILKGIISDEWREDEKMAEKWKP